MATFKKTMSGDDRYSITLTVTEVSGSVNITDNTSQISYSLTATKSSGTGYYTTNTNNPYKVTIDGVEVKDATRAYDFTGSTPKTITLASGTRTIEHNTDGSKTISCSGYFKDANNSLGKATASGSLTLSNIPRASKISYSGTLILGTAKTIDFTRYDQSFKHTLSYRFESQSAYTTIATNLQTDTYSWTPPITLAQLIPASTSGRMDLKCDTYKADGTTLVGTYLYSVMAGIPSTLVPSASISNPTIGGDAPSSWGLFVKGKSTATYTITGTGNQGSTMVAYKSWVDGYTYDTASVTTNKLTTAGTNIITAYVIDSRGKQSTNVQKTFSVVDYTNPSISVAQVQRCDANGNINNNGEYVYVSFNGSVTSLNNNNTNQSTYSIKYKISSASTYSNTIPVASATQSITKSGMLYTDGIYAANRGSGTKVQLPTTNTYNIQFVISDYFTTTTNVQTLDTGFDLLNFNASGKSMAIGKVSEATASESKLEIGLNTTFNANITMASGKTITGNLTGSVNGNANTATTLATFSYSRNNATNTWCKVATTQLAGTWGEKHAILFIKGTHNSNYNQNGIIAIDAVGGGTAGAVSSYAARFFSCTPDLDASNFYIEYKNGNADTPATINFWLKMASAYAGWHVKLLQNVGWTVAQSTPTTTTMPSSGFAGKNSERYGFAARSYGDKNGADITTTYQTLPKVLYDNSDGTSGTVTLSETSANFIYLEIFYYYHTGNGDFYNSVKICSPNGKVAMLIGSYDNGTRLYHEVARYTISGTSITRSNATRWRIGTGGENNTRTNTTSTDPSLWIVKVLGYK